MTLMTFFTPSTDFTVSLHPASCLSFCCFCAPTSDSTCHRRTTKCSSVPCASSCQRFVRGCEYLKSPVLSVRYRFSGIHLSRTLPVHSLSSSVWLRSSSECDWQMPGVIRSSRLRWTPAAWNTPLQLSDVSREMKQTLQMREKLGLISHYKCCLLRVSGFSPAAHDSAWPDCALEGRSAARNISLGSHS